MESHDEESPVDGAAISAECDKLLSKLERILGEQVSLARRGEFEKVASLATTVEKLLARVATCASPGDRQKANRCRDLYDELCLSLRTETSELADRLKHMGKGKRSLRAYRDGLAFQ